METVQNFLTQFRTVLQSDNFEVQQGQSLGDSGITADLYACRKKVHYLIFDLQQNLKNDLAGLPEVHRAACKWVDSQYKIPKSLRFQVATIQTIFVTAEPFTRKMQDEVLSAITQADSQWGGEISNATLIDLQQQISAPLKDILPVGGRAQSKVAMIVKEQAQRIFGNAGSGDVISPDNIDLALPREQPKMKWPPSWSWFFIVLCGAMIGMGGALPSGLGMAGAASCYQVAQDRTKPLTGRIVKCVGITLGVWVLFFAIGFVLLQLLAN
ncbi:MAG: hypothetical protein AAGA60_09570 [Cyanobacteria bacterium P01_E01_bin.42]